jgi:acyl-CoA oxidase
MAHYVTNERLDVFTKRMELIGLADPAFWTRFGVHYDKFGSPSFVSSIVELTFHLISRLFLGAIRSGATANQFSYWLEK